MKNNIKDVLDDIKIEKERMDEYKKYGPPCDSCTSGAHNPRVDDLCNFQCMSCGALFDIKALKNELILQLGPSEYRNDFERLINSKKKASKRKFEPGYRDFELTLFEYESHNGEIRSRYFYEN